VFWCEIRKSRIFLENWERKINVVAAPDDYGNQLFMMGVSQTVVPEPITR
jgi:hypothetical protein